MTLSRRTALIAAASALAGTRGWAAGDFPTRPVVLWVPWAAGGATDVTLRLLADVGHAPQLEQPRLTAGLINRFAARLGPAGAP